MTIDTLDLKKILNSLEEMIPVIDKIGSGFSTQESTALALLIFFREEKILDKLSFIRKTLTNNLSTALSVAEFNDWIEEEVELWIPPYNKSQEEMIEILNKTNI